MISVLNIVNAQTYIGNIILSTQQDVDDFENANPDISIIDGDVSIIGIQDGLVGLDQITAINGNLLFDGLDFNVFGALSNLTTVGAIEFQSVNYTANLDAFTDNLQSVGSITFSGCAGDESLNSSLFNSINTVGFLNLYDCYLNYSFPSLVSIGSYNGQTNLAAVSLPSATTVQEIYITGDNFLVTPLPEMMNITNLGDLHLYQVNLGNEYFTLIENVQVIHNLILEDIYLFDGFIGLNNLTTISGNLEMNATNLYYNFSDLTSLTTIQGALNLQSCTFSNLDGLETLEEIGSVIFNDSWLEDISAISQATINNGISITNCPYLQVCHISSICNYLSENNDALISDNDFGCSTSEEVISQCSSYATITGNFFYDFDCNGVFDLTDIQMSPLNIQIQSNDATTLFYSYDGYTLLAPLNSTVTLNVNGPNGLSDVSQTIDINSANMIVNLSFCPSESLNETEVLVFSYDEIRPGFESEINICAINQASQTFSGTLEFTLPDNIQFSNIQSLGGVQNGNIISWTISGLEPFSQECFVVIVTPTVATPLGTQCLFSAELSSNAPEVNPTNNTAVWETTVIGSYDPNDKQVNIETIDVGSLAPQESTELIYTVRFQNTGNASAINVRVEDIIEEDLDINTLQMIDASHDYYYEINGDQITWYFDNINLPDATTNEEESQGHFSFTMHTTGNQIAGSVVENNVSIFFDFNEPIVTNTATTTFYECPAPPTIDGPSEVCGLDVVMFSTPDNSFPIINWYFEDVFIASASQVPMAFAMPGDYNIILEVGDDNCTTTSSILVTAYEVPTVEIFNMDNTLFTQVIADSYQWYLDGNPIDGATESVYNPTEPGIYSLFVVFESGCENESNAINFTIGIDEFNSIALTPYPNPFEQTINLIATENASLPLQIELYDMIGNKVYSNKSYQKNNQLDAAALAAGTYLCRVLDADGKANSTILEKK